MYCRVHTRPASILRLWCLVLMLVALTACAARQVVEKDLAGEWRAAYDVDNFGTHVGGVENLTLTPDGKFKQRYVNDNYKYESDWGNWKLVQLPNGRYQLHLEHARFYPEGTQLAEELASGERRIARCDPGTGKTISVKDTVILNIEVSPSSPRQLELLHLPVGDPDAPDYVRFELVQP